MDANRIRLPFRIAMGLCFKRRQRAGFKPRPKPTGSSRSRTPRGVRRVR